MYFLDEVTVKVKGGDGGAGAVTWRREMYVPRGGPDGGDGGNGGAVIFVTEPGLNTLIDFSFNPHLRAEAGKGGESNQKTGRNGEDLVCKVPVGTQVFYGERLVADLARVGARWIAARGGRGGKGNAFFRSATNQAPEHAQPGQPGEERSFRLILKSVADVGLVGFPNVGKSTLISCLSAATPKVADYPFTTLTPHLGVVLGSDGRRFVMADIPGLIPGAHEGKGLGIKFLKHVERTAVLAQLIDVTVQRELPPTATPAPEGLDEEEQRLFGLAITQYEAIEAELRSFSPALAERPRIVLFSKCDLEENQRAYEVCRSYLLEHRHRQSFALSSATSLGVETVKKELFRLVSTVHSGLSEER